MLSPLSIIRVVMATTVDVTPDRTEMGDRQPNSRLAKAHNHRMEAQSETSLSTVIATDAYTARRVLPDSPTDDKHQSRVRELPRQLSVCLSARSDGKSTGQTSCCTGGGAVVEPGGAGPVAVPERCEGLEVVVPNSVQNVNMEGDGGGQQ